MASFWVVLTRVFPLIGWFREGEIQATFQTNHKFCLEDLATEALGRQHMCCHLVLLELDLCKSWPETVYLLD